MAGSGGSNLSRRGRVVPTGCKSAPSAISTRERSGAQSREKQALCDLRGRYPHSETLRIAGSPSLPRALARCHGRPGRAEELAVDERRSRALRAVDQERHAGLRRSGNRRDAAEAPTVPCDVQAQKMLGRQVGVITILGGQPRARPQARAPRVEDPGAAPTRTRPWSPSGRLADRSTPHRSGYRMRYPRCICGQKSVRAVQRQSLHRPHFFHGPARS